MSEQHKFGGRLREMELEARALKLNIQGLRDAIRDKLDPLEDVEALEIEVVVEEVGALADLHIRLKELQGKIDKAKKLLGR